LKTLYRKRLTGKQCINKLEKLQGTVIYCSKYLVQVKLANDKIDSLSYNAFIDKYNLIEQPKLEDKKRIYTPKKPGDFKKRASTRIRQYFETEFIGYVVELRLHRGQVYKVCLNDLLCGYIEITDESIKLSYFIKFANPLLAKYEFNWWGRPKFNMNYEFKAGTFEWGDLTMALKELTMASKYSK
jgi:hypothetical protein